jgi:ABC-type nitrate/sulfonate/bicarbonate transport system ATPase subunit
MTMQTVTGAKVAAHALGRRFELPSGSIEAIRDVSLTIEPGEFCCIVGPSDIPASRRWA